MARLYGNRIAGILEYIVGIFKRITVKVLWADLRSGFLLPLTFDLCIRAVVSGPLLR